jgi:hypothetical protein
MENRVTHLHFNADRQSYGFYTSLGQLPKIYRYLVDKGLI